MGLKSMTGFASRDGVFATHEASFTWTWDVRSVNGKSLDVRFRLPASYYDIEQSLRRVTAEKLSRGHVNAGLALSATHQISALQINDGVLQALLKLSNELSEKHGVKPLTMDGLLGVRALFETENNTAPRLPQKELKAALLEDYRLVLDDLVKARMAEGEGLLSVIEPLVDEIESLTGKLRQAPERSLEAVQAKLHKMLNGLLENAEGFSEDRLHQEAVLLMTKADVQEELDRLDVHVKSARDLMRLDEPVGRRLDFLTQEFNREANTLCSKSNDSAITTLGLALKGMIDQLREQVQNIE